MKRIITLFSIGLLLMAFTSKVSAQRLGGIRIESNAPVDVYIGGNKACDGVQTCMIANLRRGSYTIEVFDLNAQRGFSQPLFRQSVFYSGQGVKDIFVNSNAEFDEYYPDEGARDFRRPMDDQTFDEFLRRVKGCSFESEKKTMIESVAPHSLFYTSQVARLAGLYSFDSERMWLFKTLYPSIVDKERIFVLLDLFSFPNSKKEFMNYTNRLQ